MASGIVIDPTIPPSGTGCVECLATGWMVVPPSSVRAVRTHRLLRLVAVTAREPSRDRRPASHRPQLRARGRLVLGLRQRAVRGRSTAGPARAPSARSADAGTRRPGPAGLGRAPALKPFAAGATVAREGPMDDRSETTLIIDELILRPWRPADAPDVLAVCQDPEIARWVTIAQPFLPADAEAFIASAEAMWRDGTGAAFAIVDAGDRPPARRRHPVRTRRASSDLRPVARTRRAWSRRRRPVTSAGGRLDLRHDRCDPSGRLHHGRQRSVGPNGRARGIPAGRRGQSLGPASRRRARRLHGLLPHPRGSVIELVVSLLQG